MASKDATGIAIDDEDAYGSAGVSHACSLRARPLHGCNASEWRAFHPKPHTTVP